MNFGLLPPDPPAEPETPADVIRHAVALVDLKLAQSAMPSRMFFSPREVQDLLLDVRNVLDSLTAPSQLVLAAQQIARETKGLWEELHREDGA